MHPFSFDSRQLFKDQLHNGPFDIVIIGGGITGAGIALDAAARGMKVALVEKGDFASGTSSRSTKLIHGGLRYLRQFQLHIVAETGRERKIVHQLAPHLVVPKKMILPILKGAPEGKFLISMGLLMYDLLAGVHGEDRKKMFGKEKTIQMEPLLNSDRLKGSGYYAEYMTDDARLTIEVIKTAVRKGAVCLNYITAETFTYKDGRVCGINCHDNITGDNFTVSGKFVVNATGPWVDDLRKENGSLEKKHLFITKGIHLVFDRMVLPVNHALYFEISDGRMIFLIPRGDKTYVGTTDTPYKGDKDQVIAEEEDRNYLLQALEYLFPKLKIDPKEIRSSWAGLRPLIYEEGKSASEISRKDEVFISSSGLISMAGGKLTGYRKMAQKVVNVIVKSMDPAEKTNFDRCRTRTIPLTEPGFADIQEVDRYEKELSEKLMRLHLPGSEAETLTFLYGKQSDEILKRFPSVQAKNAAEQLFLAELDFCLENEMVMTPLDFLERRSSKLYFQPDSVKTYRDALIQKFAAVFSWDTERTDLETARIEARYGQVTGKKITS